MAKPPRQPKANQPHAVKAAAIRRRRVTAIADNSKTSESSVTPLNPTEPPSQIASGELRPPTTHQVGVAISSPIALGLSAQRESAIPAEIVERGAAALNERETLTISPAIWAAEREDFRRRIDGLEAALRKLEPIAAEVENARRRGIGGNQPPELLLDTAHVTEAIAAANVFRTQLSSEQPDPGVVRLCGLVFKRIALAVAATSALFASGLIQGIGKGVGEELLKQLGPMLSDFVAKIEHLFK
jgi:hypothetical protein